MNPEIHTEYESPPTGQTVRRFDHCSCFSERQSLLAIDPICWFCKWADFRADTAVYRHTSVCRNEINKLRKTEE